MQRLIATLDRFDPFQPMVGGPNRLRGELLAALDQLDVDELIVLLPSDGSEDQLAVLRQQLPSDVSFTSHALACSRVDEVAVCHAALGELVNRLNLSSGESRVLLPRHSPSLYTAWFKLLESYPSTPGIELDAEPFLQRDLPRIRRVGGEGEKRGGLLREPTRAYSTRRPPAVAKTNQNPELVARACGLIAAHPSMKSLLTACGQMGPHAVPVLIQGETGSGKELVAQLVHRLSSRVGEAFVPVNCGALPEKLIESILFGHKKGAFTGAVDNQTGKFVQADQGTLFLDEIGDMPLELQTRLLRVLEDGVVEPVGANKGIQVDVRIIAATHRDLNALVADGRFREDLYYRLSYGLIHLPPLRDRRSDIPLIAHRILQDLNRRLAEPKSLSEAAMAALEQHHWPGNVRELENVLGRSATWVADSCIGAADLKFDRSAPQHPTPLPELIDGFSLEHFLGETRARLIDQALTCSGGNQSEAARLLGISPQAVSKFRREQRQP